ncbi:MAG: hypothetical protein JXB20_06750, partial [Bacilli bacterium]|nr:hypothetical protein [Bacilli bacterium]
MNHKKRKATDKLIGVTIGLVSLIGLVILILVFAFIIKNGSGLLSFRLITGNYHPETYNVYYDGQLDADGYEVPDTIDGYYSSKWGIALKDDLNFEGKHYILITYVAPDSPFARISDKNDPEEFRTIANGQSLEKVIFSNNKIILSKNGAQSAIEFFESSDGIKDMMTTTVGNGIRG